MNSLGTIVSLILLLVPELALACPRHAIDQNSLALQSIGAIFFNLALLLTATIPLGFVSGQTFKRLSPAGKITLVALITSGLLATGGSRASACHGSETVAPILKEIYAAQLDYHKKHGIYASSFEELGMAPSSNQYSYFLPSETLSAINPMPKDGVDLSRLPEGTFPVASADKFTVVALAFVEPNRLDIWTMGQDKVFKEWSLPAISKVERKPQEDGSATWQRTFNEFMNKFEGPLMWMTLILGLTIGFNLSARASMMPRLARL